MAGDNEDMVFLNALFASKDIMKLSLFTEVKLIVVKKSRRTKRAQIVHPIKNYEIQAFLKYNEPEEGEQEGEVVMTKSACDNICQAIEEFDVREQTDTDSKPIIKLFEHYPTCLSARIVSHSNKREVINVDVKGLVKIEKLYKIVLFRNSAISLWYVEQFFNRTDLIAKADLDKQDFKNKIITYLLLRHLTTSICKHYSRTNKKKEPSLNF